MKSTDYHIPLFKGNIYHIYNRANGNEKLFYTEANYLYFLRQYEKYLFELLDTFAFCLLPNHFHFLVDVKVNDSNLISENFRKLFISYSMSINIQEKRKGNLFQRTFKRKIIENENYFYQAVYYIHSNPAHHRIVKDFRKYKYSSYRIFLSDKETKLSKNIVLEWFGGINNFVETHNILSNNYYDDNYIIEDN
ncbi:MAG: transposase [Ignavibacteriales bacterium]|nr:transposase [Ignavibacteriales bacterium]